MTTTRIYRIAPTKGEGPARLVRATHPATALRHVAADAFEVRVGSQDDLLASFEAGVKVEAITAEQQELPA